MTDLPRIRKVFGPLKMTVKGTGISWSFTGIRENGDFCRWTLWFNASTRKFKVYRNSPKPGDEKLMTPGLFPAYEHAEVRESRIGPLLREQLKPHHIAEATRLALKVERKSS